MSKKQTHQQWFTVQQDIFWRNARWLASISFLEDRYRELESDRVDPPTVMGDPLEPHRIGFVLCPGQPALRALMGRRLDGGTRWSVTRWHVNNERAFLILSPIVYLSDDREGSRERGHG
jgi:hypothetical protein